MTFKTHLQEKETIAQGTTALILEKPKNFSFLAGQYIDLGLVGQKDLADYDSFRTLTLASAPQEDQLILVYRNRDSEFKNRVSELPLGSEMIIEGPFGRFILPEEDKRVAVFLAGGVGVVPFVSIIKDEIYKRSNKKIYLFYSNFSLEEAAYLKELQNLEKENSNFKSIPTFTSSNFSFPPQGGKAKPTNFETGYISMEMIEKYIDNTSQVVFYLCGTPDMIFDLRMMLNAAGVPSTNIRTESFDGY